MSLRSGSRVGGGPVDHRQWGGIDALLAQYEPDETMPRTPRPPTPADSYAAEHPEATYTEQKAMYDLQRALEEVLPGFGAGSLRSSVHGDDVVSMDPASFRIGPPAGPRVRALASGRPHRGAVDAWLAAGGWERRRAGAASLALLGPDSEQARAKIDDQWRHEMRMRGWEGKRFVRREWRVEGDGTTRMYWWTTEKAPGVPPESGA